MIPRWVGQYVGIPFAPQGRDRSGCDCIGLVNLVLRDQFHVELPDYREAYSTEYDQDEIACVLSGELPARGVEIAAGKERCGDVIVLRVKRDPTHVGLVIDRKWMLNVRRGANACIERYDSAFWRPRLVGFWRPAIERMRGAA